MSALMFVCERKAASTRALMLYLEGNTWSTVPVCVCLREKRKCTHDCNLAFSIVFGKPVVDISPHYHVLYV